MTPNDLIKLALKQAGVVGIGQTPMAEDLNDALALLNMMLAQWSHRRWLVPHLVDTSFVATGALSYTMGPGATLDMVRPDSVEIAFVRLLNAAVNNQIDFPLEVLRSYEDYARLGLKTQAGFPQAVFLDTGTPWSTLYVWPVPDAAYEIHVVCKATLGPFASIAQQVNLPAEYQEAMLYNLAVRCMSAWQRPLDAATVALAKSSLNTLRATNAQVPLLRLPDNLVGGRRYNVISDR